MEIVKSASKIVFILLAVTACAGFFFDRLDAKDFMVLAMAAFSFYFANKGSSTDQYLGK